MFDDKCSFCKKTRVRHEDCNVTFGEDAERIERNEIDELKNMGFE